MDRVRIQKSRQDLASKGWGSDSVASHLLKPNTDPGQFDDLPRPSTEESKRVLDQIEGVDVQETPDHVVSVEAVAQDDPGEINQPGSQLDNVASLLQQAQDNGEPVAEQTESESVADVLARMRAAGSLDQPDSDFPVSNESALPAANTDLDDEKQGDSVQDYMNQLMNRLRGTESNEAPPVAPVKTETPAQVDKPDTKPRSENHEQEDEDLTPANPMLPGEFKPGAVAPEKTSTLDALRQVANQSVENAIRSSTREKSNQTSIVFLAASGISLFISAVLFMLSSGVLDLVFVLGILFAVGCVGSAYMFLSLNLSNDKQRKRSQIEPNAESDAEPNSNDPSVSLDECDS